MSREPYPGGVQEARPNVSTSFPGSLRPIRLVHWRAGNLSLSILLTLDRRHDWGHSVSTYSTAGEAYVCNLKPGSRCPSRPPRIHGTMGQARAPPVTQQQGADQPPPTPIRERCCARHAYTLAPERQGLREPDPPPHQAPRQSEIGLCQMPPTVVLRGSGKQK